MGTISDILEGTRLPRMVRVRQQFDEEKIEDVTGALMAELSRPAIMDTIRPGMSIAITCGSRGIDNYAKIIRETAAFCISRGAKPFIIPAMGSHGGATAQGQRAICESYGVTEDYCGCPIRATMDTIHIGNTPEGNKVYIDAYAAGADGIIVINRIKKHTAFRGPYESGIMKMMAIGLGKQYGASVCHQAGYRLMAKQIPMFGNAIIKHANILFAIGLVENPYDRTCKIAALTREEIPQEEPRLLELAKRKMAQLLPGEADVLVVDWIGKDISGAGMDPNITGTKSTPYAGEQNFHANRIAVLNLTGQSHGSIHGVGYADVINRRVFDKADLEATYPNSLTSTTLRADAIPVMMKNDIDTIRCAVMTCNAEDPENPRVIRIRDTLHISEILVSENMLERIRDIPGLFVIGEPEDWQFDEEGNLNL
jgi:hypothetical protein